MPNSSVITFSRILLAIIFILAGFGKLMGGPANFAGYLTQLGFPAPLFFAWATTLLELVGGILLLVGFQVRAVAIALAAFCVASAFVAHFDFADQNQMSSFLKNIALAGGYLLLTVTGAGPLSIDGRKA
jgi:putative oxidoreductase